MQVRDVAASPPALSMVDSAPQHAARSERICIGSERSMTALVPPLPSQGRLQSIPLAYAPRGCDCAAACSAMMERDMHTLLDGLTLAATAYIIFMMVTKLKTTWQSDKDTLLELYIVRPCIHRRRHGCLRAAGPPLRICPCSRSVFAANE